MMKSIANIALTLLLTVPVLSWITVLGPGERQKINMAFQFPGDVEDQQDDSNPTKDNETDQDNDFIIEKYSFLRLPLCLTQNESRQESLFKDHHREVVTPPPKK